MRQGLTSRGRHLADVRNHLSEAGNLLSFSNLSQCAAEEVPECHVAHIPVRHHDVLQATIPLELSYCFLEEAARERWVGHVGRIIPKDGSHVLVQSGVAHALQAQKVLICELSSMLVVKRFDNLGQSFSLILVVRLGCKIADRSERLRITSLQRGRAVAFPP